MTFPCHQFFYLVYIVKRFLLKIHDLPMAKNSLFVIYCKKISIKDSWPSHDTRFFISLLSLLNYDSFSFKFLSVKMFLFAVLRSYFLRFIFRAFYTNSCKKKKKKKKPISQSRSNILCACKCFYFLFFFLFNEWEHRTGTWRPFLSLHPLRKGSGSQYQVIKRKKKKKS